jgi:hypothetical protein
MKHTIFALCLVLTTAAHGQLKNFSQLNTLSTLSYNALKAFAAKEGWKVHEEGKMDTLSYLRLIPNSFSEANMGDCLMVFYKAKDVPINYIVFQSMNKATFEKRVSEVKQAGYLKSGEEKQGDELKAVYIKDKYNVSVTKGRQKPGDPMIYMVGIKILPPATPQKGAAPVLKMK